MLTQKKIRNENEQDFTTWISGESTGEICHVSDFVKEFDFLCTFCSSSLAIYLNQDIDPLSTGMFSVWVEWLKPLDSFVVEWKVPYAPIWTLLAHPKVHIDVDNWNACSSFPATAPTLLTEGLYPQWSWVSLGLWRRLRCLDCTSSTDVRLTASMEGSRVGTRRTR